MKSLLIIPVAVLTMANLQATLVDVQEITLLSKAQDVEQLKVYAAWTQERLYPEGFNSAGGSVAVVGNPVPLPSDPSSIQSRASALSLILNLEDVFRWTLETSLWGIDSGNAASMTFHLNEPATFRISLLNPEIGLVALNSLGAGDYQFLYSDSWDTPGSENVTTGGFNLEIRSQRVPETGSTLLLLTVAAVPLLLWKQNSVKNFLAL